MNYHHLHYFWIAASEGGMARAAARLGVAVQTVSAQVHALERELGVSLFKPQGRQLVLTSAGEVALRQAQELFRLGEALPALVRDAAQRPQLRLSVGLADGLPKLLVQHLLAPVLQAPGLRLQCDEDEPEALLSALALHKLDLVLTDRPPPPQRALRLLQQRLIASPLSWYAQPALAQTVGADFPAGLARVSVLLPSQHAAVRPGIDRWIEQQGLVLRVAGEFQDSALLKTFGAGGLGAFPALDAVHDDLVARYGVHRLGPIAGVEEQVWALAGDTRILHPLVARILQR